MASFFKYHGLKLALGLAVVYTLAVAMLPDFLLIMMPVSFACQAAFAFLITALFLSYKKKWLYVVALTGLSAVIYGIVFDCTVASRRVSDEMSEYHLKAVQVNLDSQNKKYEETLRRILEKDPDIIAMQEVTPEWGDAIYEEAVSSYPYHKIIAREGWYGIALLSKYPLQKVKVVNWGNTPNILALVALQNEFIHVTAVHTRSPVSPGRYRSRNQHLLTLSAYLGNIPFPSLLMGDLNAVPWDTSVKDLLNSTGHSLSRNTFAGTFPNELPDFLTIPLDYIIISDNISCIDLYSLENPDSDHKALLGKYRIGYKNK